MAQSKTPKEAQPPAARRAAAAPKAAPARPTAAKTAAKPAAKAEAAPPKPPPVKELVAILDTLFPDWNMAVPGRKKLTKEEIVGMWFAPGRAAAPSGRVDPVKYYEVTAEHHRKDGPGRSGPGDKIESKFEGKLPVVRVKVPAGKSGASTETINTHWGEVIFEDRRLPTLSDVNDWVKRFIPLGQPVPSITRADLITPPRTMGHRFAAVALYLLYKDKEKVPFGYIFEAGMAAGQPKTLYLSLTTQGETVHTSGYAPTPFAFAFHTYAGSVKLNGDELEEVVIKAYAAPLKATKQEPAKTEADHYLTLTARYKPLTVAEAKKIAFRPWTLLGQAAMRVLEIARAKGVSVEAMNKIAKVLLHDVNPSSDAEADKWKTRPKLISPLDAARRLLPKKKS